MDLDITDKARASIFQADFPGSQFVRQPRRGGTGAQGRGLARIRCPACQEDQVEGGRNAAVCRAVSGSVNLAGPVDQRARREMAGPSGKGAVLAHGAQIAHEMQRRGIADLQRQAVGDRQREARALQERARLADLGHRRNSRRKSAAQLRFGLCEAGAQFMQGAAPEEGGDEKAIGEKRKAGLHDLAHRIFRPVQAKRVDHQIMRAPSERKGFIIRDGCGFGQCGAPEIGKTAHDSHVSKVFVNQFQPILQFVGGVVVKKEGRVTSHPLPVAPERCPVCQCTGHDPKDRAMKRGLQTALHLVYPPRCTICGTLVESDFGLCGPCWRDTPFISGLCCDSCGVPLPGEDDGDAVHCDDCMKIARPWRRGRAALIYRDNGRKLVLSLKHGDRHDVIRPAALWLARAARPLLDDDTLIAPIPLHWLRMLSRRFNQAALLAQALARESGHEHCPDLLIRPKRTRPLEGMGRDARHAMLDAAIRVHPRRAARLSGRKVLLVDDVMTSGATFSSAAQSCFAAGAADVCVLALARVAKDA